MKWKVVLLCHDFKHPAIVYIWLKMRLLWIRPPSSTFCSDNFIKEQKPVYLHVYTCNILVGQQNDTNGIWLRYTTKHFSIHTCAMSYDVDTQVKPNKGLIGRQCIRSRGLVVTVMFSQSKDREFETHRGKIYFHFVIFALQPSEIE